MGKKQTPVIKEDDLTPEEVLSPDAPLDGEEQHQTTVDPDS